MLLPKFTIRSILVLTTICSFFFFIITFAVRGKEWAIAASIGIGSAGVAFACYAFFFHLAQAVAVMFGFVAPKRSEPAASPFAEKDQPPPQIIQPTNIDVE